MGEAAVADDAEEAVERHGSALGCDEDPVRFGELRDPLRVVRDDRLRPSVEKSLHVVSPEGICRLGGRSGVHPSAFMNDHRCPSGSTALYSRYP